MSNIFFELNFIVAVLYAILLIHFYRRRPYLLVKPSFIILAVYFPVNILPSLIVWDRVVEFDINPLIFSFVNNIVPLLLLCFVSSFDLNASRVLYFRIRSHRINLKQIKKITSYAVLLCMLIFGLYLTEVPFKNSGLFAVLFDPNSVSAYREQSFTLIRNPSIIYSFSLLSSTLAPFVVGSLSILFFSKSSLLSQSRFVSIFVLILMLFIVSIYGARGPAVYLIMTLFYGMVLISSSKSLLRNLALGFIFSLFPAILISFLSNQASEASIGASVANIFDRSFARGFLPNIYWLDYYTLNGLWGIEAFPKLASLFQANVLDPSNVIYSIYYPSDFNVIETGQANANTFVQYFCSFGLFGSFACSVFIVMLDKLIVLLLSVNPSFLVPLICTLLLPSISVSFSQINTSIVSKGFLYSAVLFLFFYFVFPIARFPGYRRLPLASPGDCQFLQ